MKRLLYILIIIAGCKEEYNPPLKNEGYNYLVVEGDIATGNDSTFIHLSRTIDVNNDSTVQPETNARIMVESEGGNSYTLNEQSAGIYASPSLNIGLNEKYRLHIFTSNGREYASDFVPVKQTPLIDSVSWKQDGNTVNIFVSTHDAAANSQYYRWEYIETWEHRAQDSSVLIYDAGLHNVRFRVPEEQLYHCWNIDTSGEILITSTTGLSSDIVFERPVTSIARGSGKISRVYSILVKQHVLTKEAYEFWDNLKKNTENQGGIFDPRPFANFGNMHCITDASEPVIGYISAGSVTQKRIFIDWLQVQWPYTFPGCQDSVVTANNIEAVFSTFSFLPASYIFPPAGAVLGRSPECVDCRLTGGGTTVKPPYMP